MLRWQLIWMIGLSFKINDAAKPKTSYIEHKSDNVFHDDKVLQLNKIRV